MVIGLAELVVVTAIICVVIGVRIMRSGQASAGRGALRAERVCRNQHCRYHNEAQAMFCARCGHRLGN